MSPLAEHPWIIAALWVLLHATDYYLTFWGAILYRRGASKVVGMGSYELNPLWQRDVEKLRWLSPKFCASLVLIGAMLWGYVHLIFSLDVGLGWVAEMMLGLLLFTRLSLIARHVVNIFYFLHLRKHAKAAIGRTTYSRGTVLFLSATSHAQIAAVVAAAGFIAPHPWIVGGAIGMGALTAVACVRSVRAPKTAAVTEDG